MDGYKEVEIKYPLAEQLETSHDLGAEIREGGLYARSADSPIGYSVRGLFNKLGQTVPDSIALYNRFELWLVPHRVSIIRRSGFAEPTAVGIEVRYENGGRTCSIISLFPSFQFIEHGRVAFNFGADMSATGEITPIPIGASGVSDGGGGVIAKCGAGLKASVGSGLSLRLATSVVTPSVSSVGVGSSLFEWRLDKQNEPLFGKDIETWAVVALPKSQRKLAYKLRFYFVSRTAFVPTRRQSDWVDIEFTLE